MPCFPFKSCPLRFFSSDIFRVTSDCSSGYCSRITNHVLYILKCSLGVWFCSAVPCVFVALLCVPYLNCFSSPFLGQFLWVNSSSFGGPWVLSPWLQGGQGPCSLDMAVFLHPKQSGQYTVWLRERDEPPLALVSTGTLPRIAG